MLKPQQTQRIYAMAARLGLLESGNKNDMLHAMVYRLTQKESIRSLDENEYKVVITELINQLKVDSLQEPPKPYRMKKYEDCGKGKMSDGQQRKVWRLMYQLEALDAHKSTAQLVERLCGIIKRELHIDCSTKQPFRWLTYDQGVKLIERLKKYVENAQRRKDGARRKV